ncbi:hypothetical protein CAP39_04550 [Sphingomonas sp. IBVSS1]|nr:hypothetical protein CAP39_04550 [Sphingomonas sp. IBVSS1]
MRQYLSAMLWITATTVIVASAQVITTRAAAERRAVTRLNIELVDNKVRIRELEAELRTRAGMPEMQRWNDAVFQMAAPQSSQILRSPVQLAAFAARPDALPRVQMAVAVDAPLAAEAPPPASETGARVLKTSFGTPAATASAALPAVTQPTPLPQEESADPTEPHEGAN